MRSKTRIAGTLIPRAARSFARSSHNRCGTRLLELGQKLSSSDLRTTACANAMLVELEPGASPVPTLAPGCSEKHTPPVKSGPPQWVRPSFTGGFPGSAFPPQPDGTLRCPADRPLSLQERRPERDGSLRILYAARIGHCRSCPVRAQCQESSATIKPRRVSAVFWPLESSRSDGSPMPTDAPASLPLAPVLWKDWPRCHIRREWLKVIRRETVVFTFEATPAPSPITTDFVPFLDAV